MESRIRWSRGELKRRSKIVLRMHYWRMILVALLSTLLLGSHSIVSGTVQPVLDGFGAGSGILPEGSADPWSGVLYEKLGTRLERLGRQIFNGWNYGGIAFLGVVVIAVLVLFLFAAAGSILIEIFVINPLYVGLMRFYARSFDVKPQFKEIFHAYENKYKNVVGVMFLRDLYTVGWCLLLVIPGIIKSYEYSMIPYLLAENPAMEAKEAFFISRRMMYGQKWRAFILDLSFLGWEILSSMTFGILGIFFVDAYSSLTKAALYRRLRGLDSVPPNVYYDGMEYDTVQGWYK